MTWPEEWYFEAVISTSANVCSLILIPPCPNEIFWVLQWILHLEGSSFVCISTVRARAGCAVCMALCVKTGRIVAIISPDCQHKPGRRLCYLAISYSWGWQEAKYVTPSGVICKMLMRAHSCPRQLRTMKNCHLVYQQSLQSSWGLRQFWCLLPKPSTCDPRTIQERWEAQFCFNPAESQDAHAVSSCDYQEEKRRCWGWLLCWFAERSTMHYMEYLCS